MWHKNQIKNKQTNNDENETFLLYKYIYVYTIYINVIYILLYLKNAIIVKSIFNPGKFTGYTRKAKACDLLLRQEEPKTLKLKANTRNSLRGTQDSQCLWRSLAPRALDLFGKICNPGPQISHIWPWNKIMIDY